MSEIEIKVDLGLDTDKAKGQLNDFKKIVKDDKIPVRLDLDNVKGDALALKNVLADAFKLDSKTLGNLKQVEQSLKQINTLLKNQSNLSSKGTFNNTNGFVPISINKNTDIIKDVSQLVNDYKKATYELKMLDIIGTQMKKHLDDFNKDQEEAFKKFVNDSKSYDTYLKELQGNNITSAMKKAIDVRKKAIQLQEELTNSGVVKVNNDQLRNENRDGSIFTIENEKWKAMFAKSESEAKDLEDLARNLQPKILKANAQVEELLKEMSDGERKLFDEFSKAYEQRPKMDTGIDNKNASSIRMYLESMMLDVDKIGLDFDNLDDVFRGLNRFYSRLEQMQNEYNTKFAKEDGFSALNLDSLIDIDRDIARKSIEDIENNTNQLEQALRKQYDVINKEYKVNSDIPISGINEQELLKMKEYIRLSQLMGNVNQSNGNILSPSKAVSQYLALSKQIDSIQTKIYKTGIEGKDTSALSHELELLKDKRDKLNGLIDVNSKYMQQELQLQQARKSSNVSAIDANEKIKDIKSEQKAADDLEKSYKKLEDIQKKLSSMQDSKGFLDNNLIEKTNNLLSETRNKLDTDGIQSDFKEISSTIDVLNGNLRDLNSGNTLNRQEASFNISLQNMENRVDSFINKCRELGNADHLIERVEQAFRGIDSSNIERANVDLRQMSATMQQAEREARQLSSTMNNSRTFFGNFGGEFRDNLFTFTAGELLADGIRNVAYSLKTLVMEYDTAFTNLKKVANPEDIMNVGQLDAIEKKAVEIAKNVGQSSQDTIQAISDTIQMAGLGMEESILVAEQTMKLANVAEMTQEAASKGAVTMLSAFKLDPLKEIPLVVNGVTQSTNEMVDAFDKINFVGNNFAVSSDGILDAIQSGANVLATYGVSMNDTIAMITAANTTLQDTSRVGNGLKTLATRLAGVKANAKDGTLEFNKTAMALKEVAGIDVIKPGTTDEIKDMATLIDELGSKWKDLSDFDKSGLSEALAGAQQAAVFQSLMQNLDVMKKVQGELGNGEHWQSMEKENAQYVDSLSGQLNKLEETWVGIFNTVFNSSATKTIVKGLVSISEAMAKVVTALDDVGMLTPTLLALTGLVGSKLFSGFMGISGALRGITTAAEGATTTIPLVTRILGIFGSGATTAAASTAGTTTAIGGLAAGFAGVLPWVAAATVAVGGLAVAYDYFNESLDEEKQRLEDSISTRKNEISSIEEQKKSLSSIADEYDKLKEKPNKTNEEVERLKTLTNEIAQIMPDLILGYDENGNAIINMTGDVKDLIEELDRATKSKQRLLDVEKGELAENSIKQLHGNVNLDPNSIKGMSSNSNSEMGKLETLTTVHIDKMAKLEKKRDDLVNKLYGTTGKERQKILKDIEKANYNIENQQSKFVQDYQSQLDVIKEYSKNIGEGLFVNVENGSIFGNASKEKQDHFLELKDVLDFSDIKTEEQLLDVEMSLSRLLKVANDGKIDLKGLGNSITDINKEFAKTNDFDEYERSMSELANTISYVTGIDVNILKDLFVGMDTSVTKSKDSLDKFLESFGKTRNDLLEGNAFAEALANQHRVIQNAIDDLNNITGDNEIDIELAYNIVNNNELPTQLRDMVRTLINKGFDVGDILEVTQRILVGFENGEIDIDNIQTLLDNTFGEGAFEISPKLLLTPEAELAGVEDVVRRLNEQYGEIPAVIETAIKTDYITSYVEADKILSLYNSFPEEVKTIISNNGYDTVDEINLINELFLNLPKEQAMNIITNYSDIISESSTLEEVLGRLSKTPIQIEPVVKAENAESALNNLVKAPVKDVIVGIKGDNTDANNKAKETSDLVDGIKQDSPAKIDVDNISANNRLKTTKLHLDEIKSKTVTVTVNTVNKTSNPSTSGNIWEPQSFEPVLQRSVVDNPSEIALLSDTDVPQTIANTGVQQLSSKARATNPISAMDSVSYSVNAFQKLEEQLKRISNELKIIGEKAEGAFGTQKISYLKQQVDLYKKQQDLQHQLAEGMRSQASELKGYLQQRGIQISADGQVLNYSQKMLSIEKEIKALRDTDSSKDNSNKNTSQIEELEKLKKSLEEYINLTTNEIPNASATWWDLENAIKKARSEAVKAELAMKNINASIDVGKYNTSLNSVRREINRLDEDIERAFGEEKEELLKKKINLIKKEQDELHKLAEAYRSQAKTYKDFLGGKGFKFDNAGNVSNLEQIKAHMNADEFEAIKDVLEDYIDLTQKTIPDLSEDWWDLEDAIDDANQAIKDSQKEQLETTKKVQDQIMDMYRKQAEEKKKLIDEELKKKLDSLEKEKKAYNDARNQQKYEDSYNDQLKKVMELESKLALLAKDDTLSGKKKYQDLLAELKDEQKKLEEIVQDKIDDDVNNMYDEQIKDLEDTSDKLKEEIDNAYSDEKLQEKVDEALSSGKFEDINGQLVDLNDALLKYIDKYQDGMSALGAVTKDEWLSNLDIARDTFEEIDSILAGLDLDKFANMSMSLYVPQNGTVDPVLSSAYNGVNITSPLIVVEGNVDRDVMDDLKSFGNELKDDIINTIYRYSK